VVLAVAAMPLDSDADLYARDGTKVLHWATENGRVEMTRTLIQEGADKNARDVDEESPLHLAARWDQLGVARILLDAGADLHARSIAQMTPLHLASHGGHSEMVKVLSAAGADPNVKCQAAALAGGENTVGGTC